jgi:hypothetical protein|tara:strand:+ start:525 stop:782 length:258 start_codon:yes stop_codon:yes gene_type:complete
VNRSRGDYFTTTTGAMTMTRKTIKVEQLTKIVNNMLVNSTCSKEIRQGMIAVLESALHTTGNYNGFNYLNGWPCEDETRVKYYNK